MLANGVHFMNRRPAAQQATGKVLLSGERQTRYGRRQQSRRAAGNDADYEVATLGRRRDFEDAPGSFDTALIGYRVARGVKRDAAEMNLIAAGHVDCARG